MRRAHQMDQRVRRPDRGNPPGRIECVAHHGLRPGRQLRLRSGPDQRPHGVAPGDEFPDRAVGPDNRCRRSRTRAVSPSAVSSLYRHYGRRTRLDCAETARLRQRRLGADVGRRRDGAAAARGAAARPATRRPGCCTSPCRARVPSRRAKWWRMTPSFFAPERLDRPLRREVEVVGAQADDPAAERVERVAEQQQLARGVDVAALPALARTRCSRSPPDRSPPRCRDTGSCR